MNRSILDYPQLLYGGDYNPEQWPENVWAEDVRLMRDAGVNFVSLGVFSWAKLEPARDHFEFAWLDRVLDLLHDNGVRVNLATATASPPAWLVREHPDVLPVTRNGVRLEFGSRQHYCPSSPHYQERALALTARLAQRYADHPALAMWHVNNEYGCHVSACYCDVSADHFRVWLKDRYSGLGALNSAWNTAFWGQHYGDWSHIEPPRAAPFYANPNHLLEWQRFCSDALLELYKSEAAILKEATPDIPVTTNFMGFFRPLDYWRWAPELDVVADDSYPDPADPDAALGAALNYDLMRSLRGGQPWILMEQATSAVQWREVNKAKGPGLMRLWSYQALARGADGVMFFQWRASRAGAEAFHSAMLPHTGPDSRVFAEVKALGQELKTLSELRHSRINADVAVLFDWSNWWALEGEAKPARLDLLGHVHELYRPLWQNNVAVDFVSPEHELGAYKLVLAPNLYLLPQDLGEKVGDVREVGRHTADLLF